MLYLYLLERTDAGRWDTYDSCVVVASNEERARRISPGKLGTWTTPENVTVAQIGIATTGKDGDVVHSSFVRG